MAKAHFTYRLNAHFVFIYLTHTHSTNYSNIIFMNSSLDRSHKTQHKT